MKLSDRKIYIFLAVFCFLLYGKTLSYDLSWLDDYFLLITARPFLSVFKNLPALFLTDAFITNPIGLYRPLLNVTFMQDTFMNGIAGGWFFTHFNNIMFHAAAACLFYRFLKIFSIRKNAAALLSLVFAAHPAASVAVGWIPGRNDTLLALFAFPAFIFADKYRLSGRVKYAALYGLMLLFAVFTKESAVFLPVLAFFWLFLCHFEEICAKKAYFKEKFNVLALFSVIPLLAWAGIRSLAYVGSTHIGIAATLRNAAYIPSIMGRALFPAWPVLMSPYDMLPHQAFSAAIGTVFLLSMAVFLAKMAKKSNIFAGNGKNMPEKCGNNADSDGKNAYSCKMEKKSECCSFQAAAFGLAWFFLLFIPTLAAGDGIGSGSHYFDHRLYVPLAGLILAVHSALSGLAEKNKFFSASLASVFILFLSAVSYCHLEHYQNRYVFWRQAVHDSPADFSNFVRAGQFEQQRGLDGQAAYYYGRAIELNPAQPMLHASLAGIYSRRGDYAAAEAEMQAELRINPHCQKCRDWLDELRQTKLAVSNEK